MGRLGLGLALALGLVASALVGADALRDVKRSAQALVVKGFAERPISSDFATWTGSFTTRAAGLAEASAALAADRAAVLAYLDAQGVPEAARELQPATTAVLFERDAQGHVTNRVEGYALTQQVVVASEDVDLVTRVAKESVDLVGRGVELSSWRPEYLYTRLDDLKIEMLGEATADARRRAEVLAEQGGGRIGRLLSAQQGVFQITPAHSTEVSDYGRNDTSSREKSIKAVVTVRYAVED